MQTKYNFLFFLIFSLFILSCNECTEELAYDFIQKEIKAGKIQPESIVFQSIDKVLIYNEEDIFRIQSSYVNVTKWAIDSTDFIYKVRCNMNEWEVLEKETTSRFYKIRKDTLNTRDEFFSDTAQFEIDTADDNN